MELEQDHGLTTKEILALVLSQSTSKDPWNQAKNNPRTLKIWLRLDQIYIWSQHNQGVPREHRHRKACYDFNLDEGSSKIHATWSRALRWVDRHGNPRDNRNWLLWKHSFDTGES